MACITDADKARSVRGPLFNILSLSSYAAGGWNTTGTDAAKGSVCGCDWMSTYSMHVQSVVCTHYMSRYVGEEKCSMKKGLDDMTITQEVKSVRPGASYVIERHQLL